jgi:hypothetical protein
VYQNYPNPFNPSTYIRFDLPLSGDVHFTVFDLLGRPVYELSEYRSAGTYEVKFDGTALASGIYLYRLNSGTYSVSKKMILLK